MPRLPRRPLMLGVPRVQSKTTVFRSIFVPARVDDHHVAGMHDMTGRLFEIVVGDRSHIALGIATTMPEPKKRGRGTSSMNGVSSTPCAGASIWVVSCILVVMRCDRTPDYAI